MIPRRISHLEKEVERINAWIPEHEKYHYGKILKLELNVAQLELRNLKQEIEDRQEYPDKWCG
jgi:hypothetical protein